MNTVKCRKNYHFRIQTEIMEEEKENNLVNGADDKQVLEQLGRKRFFQIQ